MLHLKFALLSLLLISCGRVPPKNIGNNHYEIDYCLEDHDCWKDAAKACPNGYVIQKYDGSKPKVVKCNNTIKENK